MFGLTLSYFLLDDNGGRACGGSASRIILVRRVSSGATRVYNWEGCEETGYRWCIDRFPCLCLRT
jgi:hypothetical protein